MLGRSAMSSRFYEPACQRDAFSSTACLIQLFRLTPCAVAERAARWCRSGPSRRLRVPEKGFLSSTPSSTARREVVVDRTLELAADPVDVGRLERRDGVGAAVDDADVKTADGVVELEGGHVALVFHHDFTPAASRNETMARTGPRPVSGAGCGRCTIIRSAPFFRSTLEPERSETSTPAASSIATMSAHRIVGRARAARCFARMIPFVVSHVGPMRHGGGLGFAAGLAMQLGEVTRSVSGHTPGRPRATARVVGPAGGGAGPCSREAVRRCAGSRISTVTTQSQLIHVVACLCICPRRPSMCRVT